METSGRTLGACIGDTGFWRVSSGLCIFAGLLSAHDVIRVTEARSLTFLGVVQAACPVDGDIGSTLVQLHSAACGPILAPTPLNAR